MTQQELIADAELLRHVAREASDESDAIERHPEVIEILTKLSAYRGLGDILDSNGHDPNAYAGALAEALAPYTSSDMTDEPELVFGLANMARMLQQGASNGHRS